MDRIPATPLLSLQPWPRPCHAALGPLVRTDGREGPGPTASAAAGTGGNESLPEEVAYPFTASCSPSYVSPQPSPTRSQGHLHDFQPSHLLCDCLSHKISSLLLILEIVTQTWGEVQVWSYSTEVQKKMNCLLPNS